MDLQKISQIKSLRELSLQGNSIFDISELEKMSLTALELSNNMIEDMSPLAGHKDMKCLSINIKHKNYQMLLNILAAYDIL